MDSSDGGDLNGYLVLYNAALMGDWERAKRYLDMDKDAATGGISFYSETPLHVAVLSGKANDFVKKLVGMLPREALAIRDETGNTALHNAAQVGNTEAAKTLVTKNPELLYMLNNSGQLPILQAVLYCQKETVKYLLFMSNPNVEHSPFQGQLGVDLLNNAIASEFLDVALDLVEEYPNLALLQCEITAHTALSSMANNMGTLFLSGETFRWWEKWIYHRVPLKQHKLKATLAGDIENGISEPDPVSKRDFCRSVSQKSKLMFWKFIRRLVPRVEEIMKKKAVHQQALLLVERLCEKMLTLPQSEAANRFRIAITLAAKSGKSEIVEVIMKMYPIATDARDGDTDSTIFLLAAKYRFQNVFNLFYSLSGRRYQFFDNVDNESNNLMHLCGKLAPLDRLNLVRGPALQMQCELQWYNEMEKFVHPSRRMWRNKQGKTPKMLFTEEHHQLKIDGEKWMKDTANGYTISAALIATAMFATIFTVEKDVENRLGQRIPEIVFMWFAVSDAISMFTSITSLMMFLSILTARYAEQDFLYDLPKRLSIGLLSLFISVTFMMISFSASLYFVFQGERAWFLIPVAAFACLPVTSFTTSFLLLEFPILVEVVYSTYGPGIFGKKTDSILY